MCFRIRTAACAGADRSAGPRCDPGRSAGHSAAGRSARRRRERQVRALDVEPGTVGDPSGIRSQRRSVPAAPSRHRASGRGRRIAAAGVRRAAAVAVEFVDGVPRPLRLHQRSLSPIELRDLVQWIVKPQILAVPGVAQAQIFGGEVRERQIEVDAAKLAAAGLTLDDVWPPPSATAYRRGLSRNADAAHRNQAQAPGATLERWRRRWSAPAAVCRCASRMSPDARRRRTAFRRCDDRRQPGILIETSTQFGANTLEVTRALELGWMRWRRRWPNRACNTIRRCCGRRVSSKAPSRSCEIRCHWRGAGRCAAAAHLARWRGALVSFSAIPLALLTTVWILEPGD